MIGVMKLYFSNNNMLITFNHFLKMADLSDTSFLTIQGKTKWLNVHPAALCFAAALATVAGRHNTEIKNVCIKSGIYLDRMGLYSYARNSFSRQYKSHDESGRFIPITQIKTQAEQSRFVTDVSPLLHLNSDPEKAAAIRYIVSELLRNTIEHSNSLNGAFVAAQYYPKTNKISLGICDTGIGLKASLNRFHYPKDDADAIRLALTPGVSGATFHAGGNDQNAGAGLYIIKSLAKITRNYFTIYSGDTEYKLLKYDKRVKNGPRFYANPFDDKHSLFEDLPNFNGTLVGVDFSLNVDKNFNELMEIVKKNYSKVIREKRKTVYRKINFS